MLLQHNPNLNINYEQERFIWTHLTCGEVRQNYYVKSEHIYPTEYGGEFKHTFVFFLCPNPK